MKLTKEIDLGEFIRAVKACTASVWFQTEDGDNLNLKSTLSQYLLAALVGNETLLNRGEIVCDNEGDYRLLDQFLT